MPPTAVARDFLDLNPEVSLSAGHDRTIVFARAASGALAHISEVPNGKACGCRCLACNENLIARQGSVRAHSFAHASGTECRHALEAMLHGLARELIARRGHLVTPALLVTGSVPGPFGPLDETRQIPPRKLPVDSIELAVRPPWKRPCLVAGVKGRELLIHIAVDRRANERQRQTLAELGQGAMQIDLSDAPARSAAELARTLFGTDRRKTWLHNKRAAALRAEIEASLQAQAEAQWQRHREAQRAAAAEQALRLQQLERERAERQQQWLERARAEAAAAAARKPAPPPRAPKPAEGSPSIEYSAPHGRLWLLHSDRPDIHFKAEGEVGPALAVLAACGATPDGVLGDGDIWRIAREGWAAAAIELAGYWIGVRSVPVVAGVAAATARPGEPAP